MGTSNRSIYNRQGLLEVAISLMYGQNTFVDETGVSSVEIGHRLRYALGNHYRTIATSRASGAAAHKRASRRLRNIRARASKR